MDACAEEGDDEVVDDCAVLVAVAAAMPPDDAFSFAAGFETSSEAADGRSSELSDVSGGGMLFRAITCITCWLK